MRGGVRHGQLGQGYFVDFFTCGLARRGRARQGKARRGKAGNTLLILQLWHGPTAARPGEARLSVARLGKARQGYLNDNFRTEHVTKS